jgi:hypothetical protein
MMKIYEIIQKAEQEKNAKANPEPTANASAEEPKTE